MVCYSLGFFLKTLRKKGFKLYIQMFHAMAIIAIIAITNTGRDTGWSQKIQVILAFLGGFPNRPGLSMQKHWSALDCVFTNQSHPKVVSQRVLSQYTKGCEQLLIQVWDSEDLNHRPPLVL
jgi:hypothetical protein